jgi:glycosyltransferase involved in cell wall biosynthesis
MTLRLWLDVEDLFEYARAHPRPSGIQRLAVEIYAALQALPDSADFVRFVRHDYARNSFRVISWQEIEALFEGMVNSSPAPVVTPNPIMPHGASRRIVRKLVYRLPPTVRIHVIDVLLSQRTALGAWAKLAEALGQSLMPRFKPAKGGAPAGAAKAVSSKPVIQPIRADDDFAARSQPGDFILVLGSPWSHPDYATLIQAHRRRGLKFGLLVYDLIPLRRPEWCERGLVRLFRAWFDSVFPLCDAVFAISRATAADVEAYTRERNIILASPVTPIPIGTSFNAIRAVTAAPAVRPLPEPGSYVLIVSTIEARKNHLLLFRVWRRMLEEMPAADVPTLVFAGRIGWLVDDLMRQIGNTSNLDGKLVVIENPTDAELASLYSGCLLTLFPSFFEGWGLPVTESLAFGKPCISSDRTSLPEAGGKLTRRFDPDNLNEAYAMIRAALQDPADLAKWEAQIRREFKPTPWSATVEAILCGLGMKSATVINLDQMRPDGGAAPAPGAPVFLESRAR